MQLQSSDFSARLRHYLQAEEIIHADYQRGVSPPSPGLEVTLDKDHGNLSLVGTQGEGGRD